MKAFIFFVSIISCFWTLSIKGKKFRVSHTTHPHINNDIKWRCNFRCGPSADFNFTMGETNVCNDVCYSFHLDALSSDDGSEKKALDECSLYFNDITSPYYIHAKMMCAKAKCSPPIAREILPPEDYRTTKPDSSEELDSMNKNITLRTDPLLLSQMANEEKNKLRKQWEVSNIRAAENQILSKIDKKLLTIKEELCSSEANIKSQAQATLEKFILAVDKIQTEEKNKNIYIIEAISILIEIDRDLIEPFTKSLTGPNQSKISDQMVKIANVLRFVANKCNKSEKEENDEFA